MLNLKNVIITKDYSDRTFKNGKIGNITIDIDEHGHIYKYDHEELSKIKIKQTYSPNPGEILYIGPGCNIPRIKLKDLLLNNVAKTTNDITKATSIFIDEHFSKITTHDWFYYAHKQGILQFCELAEKAEYLDEEELFYIKNLLKDLSDKDEIAINHGFASELSQRTDPIYNGVNIIHACERFSNHINIIVPDHVESYNYIINNLDKVYDYKSLIAHINSDDSITIDEKVFKQLGNMFQSQDTDNHILAMEIMANSNYLDSLMYLEMLFCDYGNTMNDCKTKRHVNFKSLTSYLGKDSNYLYQTTSDDVIQSLIDRKEVTIDKLHYIFEKYNQDFYSNTEHFSVKQITLSDELLKIVNENYVNIIKEDYVPEKREEIEEKVESNEEFNWVE